MQVRQGQSEHEALKAAREETQEQPGKGRDKRVTCFLDSNSRIDSGTVAGTARAE